MISVYPCPSVVFFSFLPAAQMNHSGHGGYSDIPSLRHPGVGRDPWRDGSTKAWSIALDPGLRRDDGVEGVVKNIAQ